MPPEAALKLDAVRTVAVLGSGTMGSGIAHVFARCGYAVILRDGTKLTLSRSHRDKLQQLGLA